MTNIDVTFHLSGGRSGHRLKNISSAILFSSMLGGQLVYNDTWLKKGASIFTEDTLESKIKKAKSDDYYDKVVKINYRAVRGLKIEKALKIIKKTINASKNNNRVLLKILGGTRIHLHQASEWEKQGLVSEGHFDKCVTTLRDWYSKESNDNTKTIKDTFAIHARRGDVTKKMIEIGYDVHYYKKLINKINKSCCDFNFCPEIRIYTEEQNSEDLQKLESIGNLKVIRGDASNMKEHFNQLTRAEFLFLSWSSFCLWASVISTNSILVDSTSELVHPKGKMKDYNLEAPIFDNHYFFKLKDLGNTIRGILEKK